MAARVTWSWQSLDDIDAIGEYIARDSAYYAQAVVEAVFGQEESISQFPQAGRVVPEFADPNVRERFVYSYRMIYEARRHCRSADCHPLQALAGNLKARFAVMFRTF